MLEYLKTDTLIDIKNQIEKILEERSEDFEILEDELSLTEQRDIFKERWEAAIQKFQELFPSYIKHCNNYLNGITEGHWLEIGLDKSGWNELIKQLQNFTLYPKI